MNTSTKGLMLAAALLATSVNIPMQATITPKKVATAVAGVASLGLGVMASISAWKLAGYAYLGAGAFKQAATMPASRAINDMVRGSSNESTAILSLFGGFSIDAAFGAIAGFGTIAAGSTATLAALVAAASFYGAYRCGDALINSSAE
jgi:hypothetical protein